MNIENKKQVAMFVLAIGLGLVAAGVGGKIINDEFTRKTEEVKKEIAASHGALIQEIQLTRNKINQLEGEIAAQKAALAAQPRVGPGGELLAQPVQVTSFAVKTPFGKRALTINIDSLSAVGGLIHPGDFVDILAQLNVPKETEGSAATYTVTTVLFQNIQVLAVGINFEPVGIPPDYQSQQATRSLYVTLAVTPEEAGLLTFSQTNGKLQLSLRPPAEKETQTLDIASWDSLSEFVLEKQGTKLLVPEKKKVQTIDGPAEEPKPFIQIFRGGREL